MANHDVAQQTLVEHEMLKNICGALRRTIGWQVEGDDGSRKLSTLRFIAHSLQRHLEHLMALEEYDGYMDIVAGQSPHLARRVDSLRQEHDEFRQAVHRILPRLERVGPADRGEIDKIGAELLELIDRLDAHSHKETALLQDGFGRDGGGEG
jgi:hemerythrin-like domain-containing protein